MSSPSQFQKQILSELGIVTWRLRETSQQETESPDTIEPEIPAAATKRQGLSGLDLIKQQMAKGSEAKAEPPKVEMSKPSETTPAAPQPSHQATAPPAKTELEFKAEVLVWQSPQLPVSDLKISLEVLDIPYQVVSSDEELSYRYAMLISSQPSQKLVADESVVLSSLASKKQLWQALQTFKQPVSGASL